MTRILPFLLIVCLSVTAYAQQSKDDAIKSALLAAPEALREEATVLGYNKKGNIIVLKKGSNEIICLADDPDKEGFSVASYHKNLDAFMARGRELKKEGKEFKEIFEIRGKEYAEGKFTIPDKAMLTVVQGDHYDSETGTIVNEYRRWVIYIPNATGVTTGLPEAPNGPGAPWLMYPGTYAAHIMISPPK